MKPLLVKCTSDAVEAEDITSSFFHGNYLIVAIAHQILVFIQTANPLQI